MTKLEFVEIDIQSIQKVTEKAVLVQLPNDREIFIPRSNLSYRDDKQLDKNFDFNTLHVARWYAIKEELI